MSLRKNKILLYLSLLTIFMLSCTKNKKENLNETKTANQGIVKKELSQILNQINEKEFVGAQFYKLDCKLQIKDTVDVSNYEIILKTDDNKVIRKARPDRSGKFIFRKIEKGSYKIALDTTVKEILFCSYKISKDDELKIKIKEQIKERFEVGNILGNEEVRERIIAEINGDSLKANTIQMVNIKTSRRELYGMMVFVVDNHNKIIQKKPFNNKGIASFAALTPKNYKVILKDKPQNVTAFVNYVKLLDKKETVKSPYKEGDVLPIGLVEKLAFKIFSSDTLDGNLKGMVYNKTNQKPVIGQTIYLANSQGRISHVYKTNSEGFVEFSGISEGLNYVFLEKQLPYIFRSKKYEIKAKQNVEKDKNEDPPQLKTADEFFDKQPTKALKPTSISVEKNLTTLVEEPLKEDYASIVELYKRGLEKLENFEYEAAIQNFTKAIELKPDYVDSYMNRAEAKELLSDFEGAIEDYTKVLDYVSNYVPALYKRAILKNEIRDYEGAVIDLNHVIELYPTYSYAYFYRGVAYNHLQNYEASIENYKKMLELTPDVAEGHFNLAATYFEMKNYKEAIKEYTKTIELEPNDCEAYLHRGQTHAIVGNTMAATKDFDKAIECNPELIEAYFEKANLKFAAGDLRTAEKIYSEAVKKFPNNYQTWYYRAMYYYQNKEFEKAKLDLNKSISIFNQDPELFYQRARLNKVLKNKCEICEDAQRAKALGYIEQPGFEGELDKMIKKHCKNKKNLN